MRLGLIVGMFTAACLVQTAPVIAQFWPGHHYGYYGSYGLWGGYASALEDSTTRYIAQSDRLMGERAAMQQQAAMQSGIRNTLLTQAEDRTRSSVAQRQSNQDWWFQVEQRQLDQQRMTPRPGPMGPAPAAGFEAAEPSAATDIIKWPAGLCDARFDELRARVEEPYRRQPKSDPTVEDYHAMIAAANKMKAALGQMTTGISAHDYLAADKFLDQLAAEARGRLDDHKQ